MSKLASVFVVVASVIVLAACRAGPTDSEVRALVQAELAQALTQLRSELIGPAGPPGPQGSQGIRGEPGSRGAEGLSGKGLDSESAIPLLVGEAIELVAADDAPELGPELVMTDGDGDVRASLYLSNDQPALTFRDDAGNVRASIVVKDDGGSTLQINDGAGRNRASLWVSRDGRPFLWLSDEVGAIRASLFVHDDGAPSLWLRDQTGDPRASLQLYDGGEPELTMLDGNRTVRAALELTEGVPRLEFRDETRKTRVLLLASSQFVGLTFADANGVERLLIGLQPDGSPQIRFFDEEGNITFSAP